MVPAWSADWSNGVSRLTSCFFGIQGPETPEWKQWIASALFADDNVPALVEKAMFDDRADVANTVYIAYWRDDGYERWWSQHSASDWWNEPQRSSEGVGYWREVFHVTADRIETLHSSPNPILRFGLREFCVFQLCTVMHCGELYATSALTTLF